MRCVITECLYIHSVVFVKGERNWISEYVGETVRINTADGGGKNEKRRLLAMQEKGPDRRGKITRRVHPRNGSSFRRETFFPKTTRVSEQLMRPLGRVFVRPQKFRSQDETRHACPEIREIISIRVLRYDVRRNDDRRRRTLHGVFC